MAHRRNRPPIITWANDDQGHRHIFVSLGLQVLRCCKPSTLCAGNSLNNMDFWYICNKGLRRKRIGISWCPSILFIYFYQVGWGLPLTIGFNQSLSDVLNKLLHNRNNIKFIMLQKYEGYNQCILTWTIDILSTVTGTGYVVWQTSNVCLFHGENRRE